MRISDWSSDVCSSDLLLPFRRRPGRPRRRGRSLRAAAARNAARRWRQNRQLRRGEERRAGPTRAGQSSRSEEHTSELQVTNAHLVCRLLLEKKKQIHIQIKKYDNKTTIQHSIN